MKRIFFRISLQFQEIHINNMEMKNGMERKTTGQPLCDGRMGDHKHNIIGLDGELDSECITNCGVEFDDTRKDNGRTDVYCRRG